MQTKFLLMMPVLVSIAGCSEKIEAQENDAASTEHAMPPEQENQPESAQGEQDSDVKLRSPVGID